MFYGSNSLQTFQRIFSKGSGVDGGGGANMEQEGKPGSTSWAA